MCKCIKKRILFSNNNKQFNRKKQKTSKLEKYKKLPKEKHANLFR